ncbi:hypothetical protein Hypma_001559 [Hypsizygus marmoreus]|uniref:Uncharacterized protein n=1 Tax=Hypsizygus marmoreus TaxID=39966 RepID=A0A369K0V7_HYPMA|nr:hypothetical protein Hypma_001559 [Hypsizygus marmoreus]
MHTRAQDRQTRSSSKGKPKSTPATKLRSSTRKPASKQAPKAKSKAEEVEEDIDEKDKGPVRGRTKSAKCVFIYDLETSSDCYSVIRKPAEKVEEMDEGQEKGPEEEPVKKTRGKKKTSVQRTKEDAQAKVAGAPANLTRSEHILESSGISVAPPERPHIVSDTLLPPPEHAVSGRVQHGDSRSGSGESAGALYISKSAGADFASSASCNTAGSDVDTDEADAHDVEMSHVAKADEVKGSVSSFLDTDSDMADHAGIGEFANADSILPYAVSDSASSLSFESGTQLLGHVSDNENEDIDMTEVTPRKKSSKRMRSASAVSPTANALSHVNKATHHSISHSTATSESTTTDPPIFCSLSPEIELLGSSKVTGGIIRGRAIGNVFNMADKADMSIDPSAQRPLRGIVKAFNSRDTDAKAMATSRHDLGSDLGPILRKLAVDLSPIRHNNSRIYIQEDGDWYIKGQYEKAILDTDSVPWMASADGKAPTLHILYEDDELSGTRISAQPAASSSHAQSSGETKVKFHAPGFLEAQIVKALDIPVGLMNIRKNDLLLIFAQYEIVQGAPKRFAQLAKDKVWTEKIPTQGQIIDVFGPRSTYYHTSGVFSHVFKYPDMQKWLRADSDAPSTKALWGDEARTTQNLIKITAPYVKNTSGEAEKESLEKDKKKGKGKGKAVEGKGKEKS